MYISGENIVVKPYTPVDAYAVMPMADGITSGGTGGDATLTDGVRFLWVYNPDTPNGSPSGFTGKGWFADLPGSPIWYSIEFYSMTLGGILGEFANGTRTNLNDVFTNWQNYVDALSSQGNDVLQNFQRAVDYECWSNIN